MPALTFPLSHLPAFPLSHFPIHIRRGHPRSSSHYTLGPACEEPLFASELRQSLAQRRGYEEPQFHDGFRDDDGTVKLPAEKQQVEVMEGADR